MTVLYRKSFIFICIAILMLLAVVSQSQTQVQAPSLSESTTTTQNRAVKVALAKPASSLTSEKVQKTASHTDNVTALGLNGEELLALRNRLNQRLLADQDDYEASLLNSMVTFQLGYTESAIDELTQLSQRAPAFHC
jgi:hypothetical protein